MVVVAAAAAMDGSKTEGERLADYAAFSPELKKVFLRTVKSAVVFNGTPSR